MPMSVLLKLVSLFIQYQWTCVLFWWPTRRADSDRERNPGVYIPNRKPSHTDKTALHGQNRHTQRRDFFGNSQPASQLASHPCRTKKNLEQKSVPHGHTTEKSSQPVRHIIMYEVENKATVHTWNRSPRGPPRPPPRGVSVPPSSSSFCRPIQSPGPCMDRVHGTYA